MSVLTSNYPSGSAKHDNIVHSKELCEEQFIRLQRNQSILNEHILKTRNIVPVGASADGYYTIDIYPPHRGWQSANMSCQQNS